MIQLNLLKENKEHFIKGLQKRNFSNPEGIIDEIVELDSRKRALKTELDNTLAASNKAAKEIGSLMKNGQEEEAEHKKKETADLKSKSKSLQEQLDTTEASLTEKMQVIPNIPHEQVPKGQSEQDNQLLEEGGTVPAIDSQAQPHWELIKSFDIIDFELGNKITGAGFPVFKHKGAKLVRGLINYCLDKAAQKGYTEVVPPVLVNRESAFGTGQLPDKDGQMYYTYDDDMFLIPTSEVSITNIYRDVILNEKDLPLKNAAYTPCFRREAGSWGAHVRGLNRLHQFDKVEIVQIASPENSYKIHETMCNHVKEMLTELELPYRIMNLCGADLGFAAALTYDFEVYAAAQDKWLEVSSVSNFETFQSNRLKLRYKTKDNKKGLLHTLNGSALALPRIIAALLENNQHHDFIMMPDVLHSYLGFDKIEKPDS